MTINMKYQTQYLMNHKWGILDEDDWRENIRNTLRSGCASVVLNLKSTPLVTAHTSLFISLLFKSLHFSSSLFSNSFREMTPPTISVRWGRWCFRVLNQIKHVNEITGKRQQTPGQTRLYLSLSIIYRQNKTQQIPWNVYEAELIPQNET